MSDRIPILFGCALRPEWIDFALDQYIKSNGDKEYREIVSAHLRPQIKSDDTHKKAVGLLVRMCGYGSKYPKQQLSEIHAKMSAMSPDERSSLRLLILTDSTPFVADCFRAMKLLTQLGEQGIMVSQLYERLTCQYGDRSTVYRRVRYALLTLSYFGEVENRKNKWYLHQSSSD